MTIARRLTAGFLILALLPLAGVGLSALALFADLRATLEENRSQTSRQDEARLLAMAEARAALIAAGLGYHEFRIEALQQTLEGELARATRAPGPSSATPRAAPGDARVSVSPETLAQTPRDPALQRRVAALEETLAALLPALVSRCRDEPVTCRLGFVAFSDGVTLTHGSDRPNAPVQDHGTLFNTLEQPLGPAQNPGRRARWLPAELSPEAPGLVTRCAAPIYEDDRFIGVVGVELELSPLLAELHATTGQDGLSLILLDDAGRPLHVAAPLLPALVRDERQREALHLLASSPDLRPWSSERRDALRRSLREGGAPMLQPLLARMLQRESGVTRLSLPDPRPVAFVPVEAAGWSLAVVGPRGPLGISVAARQRMDAAMHLYLGVFLAVFGAAFVLITLLGLWQGHKLSAPLASMIHSIRAVSRGGPWKPLSADTGDELQILAESANAMVTAIREQEQLLADVFNGVNEAILLHDAESGLVLRVNRQTCRMFKRPESDFLGSATGVPSSGSEPYTEENLLARVRRARAEPVQPFQWQAVDATGTQLWVEISLTQAQINGVPVVLAVVRDISERVEAEQQRRELEQKMLDTQKLESLGVMAGGIAHDFNNLLTAILGNTELARLELTPDAAAHEYLSRAEQASRRAAELCRQMLAYSGRGALLVESVDLSQLVEEMLQFMHTVTSRKADLRLSLAPQVPRFAGDASQIRQVAMNLVLNASEALDEGRGVIDVVVSSRTLGAPELTESLTQESLAPGQYVCLEVSDTGKGMSEETRRRIFEPFFTTKFTGRGLGLSAVAGIVKRHRGLLTVHSEEGRGTRFTVAFPVSDATATAESPDEAAPFPALSGAVLLVDDEPRVRRVAARMLARLQLSVLLADDGRSALDLYRQHRAEIRLVIMDLTMPNVDGEQAFEELRRLDPTVKVILTSGNAELELVERFRGRGLAGLLPKPFSLEELRRAVKEALSTTAPC